MKNLLFGLLISANVFAAQAPAVTQITKGSYKVVVLAPHCPIGAMCGPVSQLMLSLPLVGCLDSAVVSYKMEQVNGKRKVTVSALNVANPASKTARCIVAPTAEKTITLGSGVIGKDSIQIEFLQNLAQ